MEEFGRAAVKDTHTIDGKEFETLKCEFDSCNILEVEVGTTGYMGGDTGHGGRTYLRIKDLASTDLRCRVISEGRMNRFDKAAEVSQIEVILGGDTEMETFIEALDFAVKTLKQQAGGYFTRSYKERKQNAFRWYLCDLIMLYSNTGDLKGMSVYQRKHRVTAITKTQFFEFGLDEAAKEKRFFLDEDYCNKVYEYVLDRTKSLPVPKYSQHCTNN